MFSLIIIIYLMLAGLEEDVSISFSEKPEEIEVDAEPACLTWIEFNLEN